MAKRSNQDDNAGSVNVALLKKLSETPGVAGREEQVNRDKPRAPGVRRTRR